ncbi:FBP domain-containing protein [Kitasatospora sp. MMS16-BH015]|uniref:FBP domain-containing protein n=1 Tax=Kitasatospora sp. MMS16-BH015 TaxID=2018025 RepID=UPI000CF2A689|nr:FBP domain-containing protein [Kitasatospora sp. MMS16-BH015]
MKPMTESEIRRSFVNCTQGEAKRLNIPRDLAELPWGDLDFLGWRDPSAPDRGHLVVPGAEGEPPVGIALRTSTGPRNATHRGLCSICLTTHPGTGVHLMAARKAGTAGREGNSVGVYICADLACPLYARRLRKPQGVNAAQETLSNEERVARMMTRMAEFVDRVRS